MLLTGVHAIFTYLGDVTIPYFPALLPDTEGGKVVVLGLSHQACFAHTIFSQVQARRWMMSVRQRWYLLGIPGFMRQSAMSLCYLLDNFMNFMGS